MKKLILAALLAMLLTFTSFAAGDEFDAGLTVTENQDGTITVVIPTSNDPVLEEWEPILSIPYDGKALKLQVTFGDTVLVGTVADGEVSFPVAKGGTYVIAENCENPDIGHLVETWEGDRGTCLVCAQTVDKPADPDPSAPAIPMYGASVEAAAGGTVVVAPLAASAGSRMTVYGRPQEGYFLRAVQVYDAAGDLIPCTVTDGRGSFVLPAGPVRVVPVFAKALPFTDVQPEDYYFDAVSWALENGITEGVSTTQFGAGLTVTRAQMVTFLWRQAGMPAPAAAAMPFTDVPADAYYRDAVLWALENGITVGVAADRFGPDELVDRSQAVTFLWRALGKPAADADQGFGDVSGTAWYFQAVNWAVREGVTIGVSQDRFAPDQDCLREQIITFMFRCLAE